MYKALDKRDGKLVAIKVLEVENEDTLELQKEINILKECDCEYIVRYKGSYRKDGNIWIVMEFWSGRTACSSTNTNLATHPILHASDTRPHTHARLHVPLSLSPFLFLQRCRFSLRSDGYLRAHPDGGADCDHHEAELVWARIPTRKEEDSQRCQNKKMRNILVVKRRCIA